MTKYLVPILLVLVSAGSQAKDIEKPPAATFKQPWPALVLLHDVYGLDNFVQREIDRYTEMGFYVVAVDYYNGAKPANAPDAKRHQELGSKEEWLAAIEKSVGRVFKNKKIDPERVGIMGWGLGATLGLRYATRDGKLKTVVTNYGQPIFEVNELKKIRAQGLSIFGEKDEQFSEKDISKFKIKINEAHLNFSVQVVPKGKGPFYDFTRTEYFMPAPAEKGKQLIADFLRKHLSLTQWVK